MLHDMMEQSKVKKGFYHMKKLVLAEKPSVGKDIAKVLNCKISKNGYMEGNQYVVTWALGHLVTLADPESYDKRYASWDLNELPILPSPLKTTVIKQTNKQFQIVKSQLLRKDIDGIIIATDAGREGELVARWIIEKAKVNKPIQRLWISSVTDKAIQAGFRQLKDGKLYEGLANCAKARAAADWYVGINATRALTTKHNAQLSCGRVQTPTLAMIYTREQQIKSFQPRTFYTLDVETNKGIFKWTQTKTNATQSFNEQVIENVIQKCKQKPMVITEVKKTPKKQFAPQLYDLTTLQRETNGKYNWSAKETLSILQRLYEQYKIVTYPRTDSRYISTDIVPTLKERLEAVHSQQTGKAITQILKTGIQPSKHFVDNQKVSDHHAIIPTEEYVPLASLSDKERKLYDMIVTRFLQILLPPFTYEETKVTAKIADEMFTLKGQTVLSLGWKSLQQENETVATLMNMKIGEDLTVQALQKKTGQTTPPALFTEGTLLEAMENPVAFIQGEDNQAKAILKEVGGIGTVATRADIIEKLFNTFVVEKKGNHLITTQKGKQLLKLAPKDLTSPVLTAKWETELTAIATNKKNPKTFIQEMMDYTQAIVSEIKTSDVKFKHDNISTTKCPNCGKFMLKVHHKKGKILVCQDRECHTRKTISQTTHARCPECKKKLELRGEGEGATFACVCGYREKRSHFLERRSKEKNTKASKQDISRYLKTQQKQEEPLNNPFADLLEKLKS